MFFTSCLKAAGKHFPRFADRGRFSHRRRKTNPSLAVELVETRIMLASVYYDFDVIAKSGDLDRDHQQLLRFGSQPSINDEGKVAFIGDLGQGFGRNGVYWRLDAEDNGPYRASGDVSRTREFDPMVQINNDNTILSTFTEGRQYFGGQWGSVPGPFTIVGRWDATPNGTGDSDVARGRWFDRADPWHVAPFEYVSLPAINNNNQAVFTAFEGHFLWESNPLPNLVVEDLSKECPNECLVTVRGEIGQAFNIASTDGSFGRPAIADNGRIAVHEATDNPDGTVKELLRLYDYDLENPRTIGESEFDTLFFPAISDDGKGIAFAGDRGDGPGIFLAVESDSGDWSIHRIAGENARNNPFPELGFDDDGKDIYFDPQSLEFSQVAVIHQELGETGIVDDSFIVAFQGKPEKSSRPNTVTGDPLLYSDQEGLWTVRLDVVKDVKDETVLRYHTTSPRAVVQIGDKIADREITNVFIGDALARATTDDQGQARTERRGDHRIVYWAGTKTGSMILRGAHIDSDEDGLLDHWETDGLDIDGDGFAELDLPSMGADPQQRDIFLEIDWLAPKGPRSFAPSPAAITQLVDMFALAPGLSNGISPGINLHVDAGPFLSENMGPEPLRGGNEIRLFEGGPHVDVVYYGKDNNIDAWTIENKPDVTVPVGFFKGRSLDNIKKQFFGTQDMKAREFVFHYAVFADQAGNQTESFQGEIMDAGGIAELSSRSQTNDHRIPGNDFIVALRGGKTTTVCGTLDRPLQQPRCFPPGYMDFRTMAHELGHNLGLRHGGRDDTTSVEPGFESHDRNKYKPHYKSVMNYAYPIVGEVDAGAAHNSILFATETLFRRADLTGLADLTGFEVRIISSSNPNLVGESRVIASNAGFGLTVTAPFSERPQPGDKFAVLVADYSRSAPFNDWDHLILDFQNYYDHLGNSFNSAFGVKHRGDSSDTGQPFSEVEELFGPLDTEMPTGTLDSPAPGASIPAGGDLVIALTASDDFGIDSVQASLDLNGNGVIDPGETVTGVSVGGDAYEVTFANFTSPSGIRTVEVTATDAAGRVAPLGTIEINVPNSPPQAFDDAHSVNGDDALAVIGALGVLSNDSDVNLDTLSAALVSGPSNGALFLNTNGSFSYIPDVGFVGTDSFTYKVNDGELESNEATVTITVNPPTGSGGPVATPRLYPTPAFVVGEGPFAVLAGDLNRDGRQDLVTFNHLSDDISVFLGRGGGAFASELRFPAGPIINRVALLKDANGDGALDVIALSSVDGGDSVALLLGNGDGTFQPPLTTSVTNSLINGGILEFVDLNGDDFQDIATLRDSFPTREVVVRLGNGDGTFQTEQTFPVTNSGLNHLAAGDLDGDGNTDVVVSGSSNQVSVFLGDGDGAFQPEQKYGATASPRALELIDANGDGVLDIFAGTDSARTARVLLGNGDGSFQPLVSSTLAINLPMTSTGPLFSLVDINSDAVTDVVMADTGAAATLYVHLGNGDGTFQSAQTVASGPSARQLVVADIDRDGSLDVATFNSGLGVSVHLGNGDGAFQPVQRFPAGGDTHTQTAMTVADLDGEGPLEVAITVDRSGPVADKVLVLFGDPDDTLHSRLGPFITDVFATKPPAVADFNGDGIADLASGQGAGLIREVAVLLGQGDGTFQTEPRFAVGERPFSIVAADLNGDGITDLATSNVDSDDVSVLLGDGDGAFQTQQRFLVGTNPVYMAAGDLNGDSIVDLVTVNQASNNISVLLGDGAGAFEPQQTFAVGRRPLFAALADLNGDGIFDAAIANSQDGDVSVLLGDGNGAFQPQQRFAAGRFVRSVTAADLNGDGILDLAVADEDNKVAILLGDGDGAFQSPQTFAAGSGPQQVVVADLNSDGDPDLATANQFSANISVLLGNGDGTFQAEQRFRFAEGGAPDSLAVGDMDGDGVVDLVAANSGHNSVSVLLGDGAGAFQPSLHFNVTGEPRFVALADLNGDGILDAATANDGGVFESEVSVLLGQGDGTLRPQKHFFAGFAPSSVAAADLNGDGIADLATANGGSDDLSVLLGNGDGTFQAEQRFAVGDAPLSVAIADLNNDGIPDLVAANALSHAVSTLLGNGDGTFQLEQRFAVGLGPLLAIPADLNGDGVADLVAVNGDSASVSVLLGLGDGAFQAEQRFGVGSSPVFAVVVDLNGDGVLDVAAANSGSDDVSLLLGNGDGTLQPQQRFGVGDNPRSVTAADVNDDGHLDLVTANDTSGDLSVLLGNGDGTFQTDQRFFVGTARGVTVADLNADGFPDFAVPTINFDVDVLLHIGRSGGAAGGNQRPVARAGGPYNVVEGAAIALDGSGSSDPDGGIALYEWDLDGDGVFDDAGEAAPNVVFEDDGGRVVTLQVTDDQGEVDTNVALVNVLNTPPTVEAGPDQTVNEGDTVHLAALFTDAGVIDTHTATIDWGDGSSLEDGVLIQGAGSGTITATHVYGDNGLYQVTVCVTDDDGAQSCGSLSILVNNVAPTVEAGNNQSVPFGRLAGLDPAVFSDPGSLDTHTATIDWGDGVVEAGGVFERAGSGTISGTHTYAADGQYTVSVCVGDDDGEQSCDTLMIEVQPFIPNEAPVVQTPDAPAATESELYTHVFSFTDVNLEDTHTATIEWGDGFAQQVEFRQNIGGFGVAFPVHTYASAGTFDVTVRVTDDRGLTGTKTTSVTVHSLNTPPTANAGGPYFGGEGSDITLDASGSTDPDNDIVLYEWDLNNDGQFDDAEGMTTTFNAPDDGLFPIAVRVTDDDGATDTATTTVTVDNAAPEITAISTDATFDQKAQPDGLITLAASFIDLGSLDTHTATIDWGDGTIQDVQVTEPTSSGGGLGNVSASHAYAQGGIYTVTLTLTDDDSAAAGATTSSVVTGAGIHDGVLYVVGTNQNDWIYVHKAGGNLKVHADFFANPPNRRFPISEVERIEIYGCDGRDYIKVGPHIVAPVTVHGGKGDDRIWFISPGNDHSDGAPPLVAFGGEGKDRISVGPPRGRPAEFYGGPGDDRLYGTWKDDLLDGGEGRDYIAAAYGDDRIWGGGGNDVLHGHSGQDLMLGGAGHDILFGGRDNDILRGGDGPDVLYGQGGDDILLGGAGNDRLYDSYHFNLLIGGEGRDRLSTRRGHQSPHGGNGLLIGSSTIYDDDDPAKKEDPAHHAALLAILAEWSSGRPLAERVSNILGGLGLAGGFPLSLEGEVVDDQTTDYLLGGGASDFFFQLGAEDRVISPQPNDHVESKA